MRRVSLLLSLQRAAGLGSTRAFFDATVPVAERYAPLRKHQPLFAPELVKAEWLHPDFIAMTDELSKGADAASLVTEEAHEIFSFPLLTEEACDHLADEVDNFVASGLPARRPNSMNRYGLILNEVGFRPSLDVLQRAVWPIARGLWPVEGEQFDSHHSFVVSYKPDEDRGLDMHTDDSDVTFNVCLGRNFTAAGLTFCGNMGAGDHRQISHRYLHHKGRAVMHLGRRRHGADDISQGHRMNL